MPKIEPFFEKIFDSYSIPKNCYKFIEGLNKVEGVKKGSFAIIFKVHHCAIDGVSGEEVLASLLDISPETGLTRNGKEEEDKQSSSLLKTKQNKIEKEPGAIRLLAKSVGPSIQTPWKFTRLLALINPAT